jgi:hypothetical protein
MARYYWSESEVSSKRESCVLCGEALASNHDFDSGCCFLGKYLLRRVVPVFL